MGTCSAPNPLLRNRSRGTGSHFHEVPILVVTGNVRDPEQDWQLERADSSSMRRWKSRKEGDWRKQVAQAQEAASARL